MCRKHTHTPGVWSPACCTPCCHQTESRCHQAEARCQRGGFQRCQTRLTAAWCQLQSLPPPITNFHPSFLLLFSLTLSQKPFGNLWLPLNLGNSYLEQILSFFCHLALAFSISIVISIHIHSPLGESILSGLALTCSHAQFTLMPIW